jgi:cathepsin D
VLIRFGTGTVKAVMTKDTVCVNNLCVDDMLMLEAVSESEVPFTNVLFDGIIGLSFSHLSINKESNFLDMLFSQGKIKRKVFSFYFNKHDEQMSQIHIGGYNNKHIQGEIFYSPVISTNYWEIKLDDIHFGDMKLNICKQISCTAIVDTGTSMIAGPSSLIEVLESLSQVDVNCGNYNVLKNLKFEINGALFNLDPEFYVIKIDNAAEIDGVKYSKCISAFMRMNALSDSQKLTIILGGPFLKKYYTIFDREENKIGFAVANHQQ